MVPVSVDDDELAELHTEVDLDEDEVSIVEPATQQHEGIMTMYFGFSAHLGILFSNEHQTF
jgi:hypothetical protein